MQEKIQEMINFLQEMKEKDEKGENINLMLRKLSLMVVDLCVIDFDRKIDKLSEMVEDENEKEENNI